MNRIEINVNPLGMVEALVTGTMTEGHSDGKEEVAVEVLPPSPEEPSLLSVGEDSGAEVGRVEEAELPRVGLARRVEVGTQE